MLNAVLTVSLIVHGDYTHIYRALNTLFANSSKPLTVYVTVNTGESDELTALKSAFPQVHYIVNVTPQSFAHNHNSVMRRAQTPYVALLNDDIEIPDGTINTLLNYLESYPDVALVTPLIRNPDGSLQLTAFSDPTLVRMIYKISGLGHLTRQGTRMRNWVIESGLAKRIKVASLDRYEESRNVPVVVGVAMFVRREAYQQAGMMDEDTRVFGEEVAWHWRLRQAGWKIAVVADASITHFNVDKDIHGWQLAEHRKGMLNYYCRYRPRWQAYVLRMAIVVLHSLRGGANLLVDPSRAKGDWMAVHVALTWQPAVDG